MNIKPIPFSSLRKICQNNMFYKDNLSETVTAGERISPTVYFMYNENFAVILAASATSLVAHIKLMKRYTKSGFPGYLIMLVHQLCMYVNCIRDKFLAVQLIHIYSSTLNLRRIGI